MILTSRMPRCGYFKKGKTPIIPLADECLFHDEKVIDETMMNKMVTQSSSIGNIQLDNREHGLIYLLPTLLPPRALHVGDIWIGISGDVPAQGGLIIERKTWADLEASVMDGRYREQRGRLLTYSQEVGARVAYIIEKSALRNFTFDIISKFIARIQLVHGIAVFQTDSLDCTATLIRSLVNTWEHTPSCFSSANDKQRAAEGIHVVKRDNDQNPTLFALKVLCLCPGISPMIADIILSNCGGTLNDVFDASVESIANIQYSTTTGKTRSVGVKVTERLYGLLHYAPE